KRLDKVMDMASDLVEGEDMISFFNGMDSPDSSQVELSKVDFERRKMDLAVNLVEQYFGFVQQWQWGDGIVEWIRQCEMTFDTRLELRHILRSDIWPHAGRSSFICLFEDKDVATGAIELEKAMGLRLTFRQLLPLRCFSNQFLLYLN